MLTSEPDSTRSHYLTGLIHVGLNQFPQALQEFERLYALDSNWPQVNLYLGVLQARLGKYDQGEKYLREEIRRDPRSFAAFFSLGAVLSKEGRYEEALKFLEQARVLNSRHSDTLYDLARAYQKTGGLDKAWEYARAAVQADPRNRPAHYLLSQLARQRGDEQTAEREFHIAQSLSDAQAESGQDDPQDERALAEPGGRVTPDLDRGRRSQQRVAHLTCHPESIGIGARRIIAACASRNCNYLDGGTNAILIARRL